MKKLLNTSLKLLLITAIFIGLQGRVLVRYAGFFQKGKTEFSSFKGAHGVQIRAGIVHCKLQCYTQHFDALDIPYVPFVNFRFLPFIIAVSQNIPFHEKLDLAEHVRLLPLRGPPIQ